ncbi:MAG: hypothetical protein R3D81_17265 [Thalassovita sp.]
MIARSPVDLSLLADVYALPPAPALHKGRLRIGITQTPFADLLNRKPVICSAICLNDWPLWRTCDFRLRLMGSTVDDLHRCDVFRRPARC